MLYICKSLQCMRAQGKGANCTSGVKKTSMATDGTCADCGSVMVQFKEGVRQSRPLKYKRKIGERQALS